VKKKAVAGAAVGRADAVAEPATGESLRHARLSDQLCFALYAASKAVSGAYRTLLKEVDLTYPQYLAMLAVWEQDGQTVAELGAGLSLDSGTLSPLLQRLERAGLIRRVRSDPDERIVRIHATSEGLAMEARVTPVRLAVESATGLDDVEFAALRAQLHSLTATIEQSSHAH
jgi:DNA-binding MarR family transcriptional regulator